MKKPSSTKQQPERVFFTDRDLGRQVPDILERAGFHVERHDEHFGPLTPDSVWLAEVGRRGWIGLSHNKSIRYNTEERDLSMRAGLALFMLIGHTTHALLARNLVQTFPKVLKFLEEHDPPFIARIYRPTPVEAVEDGRPGRVNLWLSHDEWVRKLGR